MYLKEVVRQCGNVIQVHRFHWSNLVKHYVKGHCKSDMEKDFPLFIVIEQLKDGELWGKSAPISECYVYERSCEVFVNKRARQKI